MRSLQIRTCNLNIDRSRETEVEHSIHHAAGLKVRIQFRHLLGNLPFDPPHVFVAIDLVVVFQTDLYECRVRGRIAGIDRGKSRRHSDVRQNDAQIIGGYDLPDETLHFRYFGFSHRNASPGRRLHVDDEHSGVASRKERQAHERKQGEAGDERTSAKRDSRPRPA